MSDISSKKAAAILQTNHNDLQFIFTKVKMLQELNSKVLTFLDDTLKQSCQVANIAGNQLTFIVANGSVATQLRFQIPGLLKKFKSDPLLKKIQNIQYKVRLPPPRSQTNQPTKPALRLSPECAEMIREMAKSIDDPKLKEILMRIAAHT